MQVKLYKNARTTLAIRQKIKNSNESIYSLARRFNLSLSTIKRRRTSSGLEDKSFRPHKINTTLFPEQEDLICFERKQFKKNLEDIFYI